MMEFLSFEDAMTLLAFEDALVALSEFSRMMAPLAFKHDFPLSVRR